MDSRLAVPNGDVETGSQRADNSLLMCVLSVVLVVLHFFKLMYSG